MKGWGVLLGLAGLAAAATGCTEYDDGPSIAGFTQTGVTLRYNPQAVKISEVDEAAKDFCAGYDKNSVPREHTTFVANASYQAYDCVDKSGTTVEPTSGTALPAVR